MTSKIRFFLAVPFLVAIAVGCSHSRTPCSVHGKITYEGEPVGGGTISFVPAAGEVKGGYGTEIKPDGTYESSGLPPGEYVVSIETESANRDRPKQVYGSGNNSQKQGNYAEMMRKNGRAPQETAPQGKYVKIPDKYNDQAKSGLKTKLTNGKNEFNVALTK